MEKLIILIAEQMIINNLISEKDKEIYVYSMQVLFEKIIGFSTIFILSFRFGLFFQSILFICFFSNVRKHANGFHLSSFYSCFLASVGLFVIYAKCIYKYLLNHLEVNYIALIIGLSVILYIGAVNNPSINWTVSEQHQNKKLARYISLAETIAIMLLGFIGIDASYLLFMSFGVILSAVLLLIEKIRKEVSCHEESKSDTA